MLKKFTLATRIAMMGILIIVAFIGLITWLYPVFKSHMYEAKWEKTQQVCEAAWGVVDHYASMEQKGALTRDEAQKLAKETLSQMRYGGNEYFWINDMSPKMIMHPIKPELNGSDVSGNKDPNGKQLFMEMVDVCRKSGGGFVEYQWPKPNTPKPVDKISYVKLQRDWGWIVGSGIYLDDVQAEMSQFFYTVFSVILVIVVLSLGGVFWMTRSITRPIKEAITQLSSGAEQVDTAAGHISSASQSLAESTTEQASSLEESASALELVADRAKQNTANARTADGFSGDAKNATEKGTRAMTGMAGAIESIKSSSVETAKIIRVIDEIAFQTNLLALNAAVEAARAGEAGKGFAVVAEEVRNLAQRSAEAAKNTSALIEQSQQNADRGVNAAKEFSTILSEVTSSVGQVTGLLSNLAAGSTEQSESIEQLNSAISQLNQVTQQNAASAEESASTSEELSAQAQQILGVVRRLEVLVAGEKA